MLFSHPELAESLSSSFECAWESLRPVPQVDIDFGNGHRLHRTLNGNIATWFCTPEGEAFDLVPGLVGREEYLSRALQAQRFFTRCGDEPDLREWVVSFHALALEASPKALRNLVLRDLTTGSDASKIVVESPLKLALRGHGINPPRVPATLEDFMFMQTKSAMSESSAHALRLLGEWTTGGSGPLELEADTRHTVDVRYPQAHRLLLAHPLARPAELTEEAFRSILHVDLEDPYLGLAPYVLGGEGGRHAPAEAR